MKCICNIMIFSNYSGSIGICPILYVEEDLTSLNVLVELRKSEFSCLRTSTYMPLNTDPP